MKFVFGDVVVVDEKHIGVIIKCWQHTFEEPSYEVYVRSYDEIIEYTESEIQRYLVRHKFLSDEELMYQKNAINRF